MSMKVLPIGGARRRLPELVRRVAEGHATVAIGRRGRCEAVLVAPGVAERRLERRSLIGLVEVVGTPDDLDRGRAELRREIDVSLERTARMLTEDGRRRRRQG